MVSRRPVVAVDVGATKIAAALVDPDTGAAHHRHRAPTSAARGAGAVLDDVADLVTELRAVAGMEGHGGGGAPPPAGIAVPEIVDDRGEVRSAATLAWRAGDVAVAVPGSRLVGDVHAAALAEARFGAGRGLSSFVYLSVGSGVSSAFVLDGSVWQGAHGAALVAASGTIEVITDAPGDVAQAFVPERVASGLGVVRLAAARGLHLPDGGGVAAVERLAAAGDDVARGVLTDAGRALAGIAARLVDVLDPHAVIVGGGLGLAGGVHRRSFDTSLRDAIWADAAREVPVLDAGCGLDAPLVGAALVAAGTSNVGTAPSSTTVR